MNVTASDANPTPLETDLKRLDMVPQCLTGKREPCHFQHVLSNRGICNLFNGRTSYKPGLLAEFSTFYTFPQEEPGLSSGLGGQIELIADTHTQEIHFSDSGYFQLSLNNEYNGEDAISQSIVTGDDVYQPPDADSIQ